MKVDGHRTVLWRTEDSVRLQSRTSRDVTALWMDLAVAAMNLPPGVVLDGEAVVYVADDDGRARVSFEAAQSRALSHPRRARELAVRHPATYVAFDVLAHPAAGLPDLYSRPYVERRQVLLDVLAGIGPPIEPVWSTTDRDEALLWYESLEGTGVEGLVCNSLLDRRVETDRVGVDGCERLLRPQAFRWGQRIRSWPGGCMPRWRTFWVLSAYFPDVPTTYLQLRARKPVNGDATDLLLGA
ncbi:hypothetical protein [Streptomyces hokutonensis]|uniref:ATP-dependent DNA ligase n=1 Tax=Streptomyces hokutonensis TaxID=1306990 RepID=UPI0038250F71